MTQLLLSRLYSNADSPEPVSEAEALSVAALYQPLEPSVPLRLAVSVGFCVSIETDWLKVCVFPALSWAVNESVCEPSLLIMIELHEPIVEPSRVQVRLAKPEVVRHRTEIPAVGA